MSALRALAAYQAQIVGVPVDDDGMDGRWRFKSMVVISENARNPLFSAA